MYALEYLCKDCKWQWYDREKVLVCPECSSSSIEVVGYTGDDESYPLEEVTTEEILSEL